MGCASSSGGDGGSGSASKYAAKKSNSFQTNVKQYHNLEDVQRALREAGLESSNLIIGIDYTKSNVWSGAKTFNGKCLHNIDLNEVNPYQKVIDVCARTLEAFDDDRLIPVYGFGDVTTTSVSVFPFFPDEHPCFGVTEVLQRYNEITPNVQLCGPTNFAPLIDKAIGIVKATHQFHILIIIADGQVTSERTTVEAIVRASKVALSIITIGVGDGPWEQMEEFDDQLPARSFDNFCFVKFHELMTNPRIENYDVSFAVAALQELPAQWKSIRKLGLL